MLERFFRLRANGTNVRTEVLGGLTTFMTMAYIVFVNPQILSGTGMDFDAVMVATCLAAGIATWVMGFAANYPIAMAPGMGENLFFLTVVTSMGLTWQTALGAVFVSGIVFFLLTFLHIREMIIDAIPASLKFAIPVGIGLFIALMGLKSAGIVVVPAAGSLPVMGDLSRAPTLIALTGLLVTVTLLARRIPGAILIGIVVATLLALSIGLVQWQGLMSPPPSLAPTFFAFDLGSMVDISVLLVVVVFLYMAIFDAIGTLIGIGEQAGFMKDGKLPRATPALMADSSGTVLGSVLGTSTVTAYIESATGVEAGARTGLANVVTGACFLLALFFAPFVRMVGGGVEVEGVGILNPLTAPALIVVGSFMVRNITKIDWSDMTEAFPAFLVSAGIPFTSSIADGIAFGFVSYPLIKLLTGRGKEVGTLVYILGVLFVGVFVIRYVLL
jgi:AGZA family xanthine/uracil permease-like MFS transporter